MPTGYTDKIYTGEISTFKEYIMLCSRAFGACVDMRDLPMDTKIPTEIKVDDFYIKRIEDTKKEIKKYTNSTSRKKIEKEIDLEYDKNIKYYKSQIKIIEDRSSRYLTILEEINNWNSPTKDHIELKKFAIEQIKMSYNFDCDISYYNKKLLKPKPTVHEWITSKIIDLQNDLETYEEYYEKEKKRIEDRNKWIGELKKSLDIND